MEGELADLYGGLARLGIDARRADGMELWEIGAAFGLHRPEDEPTDPSTPKPPPDPYDGFDPIKARVEAARKGLPPPAVPPPRRR